MYKKLSDHRLIKKIIYLKPKKFQKELLWCLKLMHKIKNDKQKPIITPKIISHSHQYIYLLNPLVGSTTLKTMLKKHYDGKIEYFNLEKERSKYKDYFIFSFVRDPRARVLSCYSKKILNGNNLANLNILSKYDHLNQDLTFSDFIDWLLTEEGSDDYADKHWLSQHKLLLNSNKEPLYDYLGRLENFQQDLDYIFNQIGINNISDIPHLASHKSCDRQSEAIKDRQLVNKIYHRYYDDFHYFNYDKPVAHL